MKYLVTLDITVEASSRDDAFEKVEKVLGSQTFCLYDAEAVEQSVQRTGLCPNCSVPLSQHNLVCPDGGDRAETPRR